MSNESAKKIHATVTGSAQPDDEPTTTRTGPANAVGADDLTEADIPPAPAVTDTTPAAARAGATVDAEPAGTATPAGGAAPGSTGTAGDAAHLHERWTAIQSTFVDDPHGSVVAAAIKAVSLVFYPNAMASEARQEPPACLFQRSDRPRQDQDQLPS